jgi:tRNA (adenine37-N6)-methyltransferase
MRTPARLALFSQMDTTFSLRPIATLRTPFAEKFGIPRQSGLVEEANGTVEFMPEFNRADFVRGLESFSHIWLVTVFHESPPWDGKATVRPPRLGGNERLGVFATRSPNRPNPIGLSLVRLVKIETEPRLVLHVAGVDAVDGTPVLDIKPYLPWCESRGDARADWAGAAPNQRDAKDVIIPHAISEILGADETLIRRLLRLEPQPAYHETSERIYGMTVAGWNVKWRAEDDQVVVLEATRTEGA